MTRVRTVTLALALVAASACTVRQGVTGFQSATQRRFLDLEYREPARRIRSPVYAWTVARQLPREPHRLQLIITVQAPPDSVVIVALRDSLPLDALRPDLGSAGMRSVRRSRGVPPTDEVTMAPPLVRLYTEDGRTVVSEHIRATRVVTTCDPVQGSFGLARERRLDVPDAVYYVVPRGSGATFHLEVALHPDPRLRDERYFVRIQWIAAPSAESQASCAQPGFGVRDAVDVARQGIGGEQPARTAGMRERPGAAAHELTASAHIVNVNYLAIGILALVVAGGVWSIAAP